MQYKTMALLLLYSGMRRGELCGLEWKDIDFENHLVNICRTSQYTPKKGIFTKGTKMASSIRIIKLPATTITILREYKRWQTEQRLAVGDQWRDCDRLYTSWNGKPGHPDSLTQWFGDFIKRTDLLQIHIHSLRHTNATLMIAGGEDILTVSKLLGHAQASTTTNIYAHAIRFCGRKGSRNT
jgi:integrase